VGELIRVASIRLDGGTQSRASLSEDVIAEYAERVAAGEKFPPIVVFHDGTDHWLADGFHRVHGHLHASADLISADVRQGTRRDAILFSVGANASHGLRRTNADKRRAVETLLRDDEWRRWASNKIATLCGVSHTFVDSVRSSLATDASEPRTFTTKHGTEATMDTSRIGKPATQPKREPQIAPVVAEVSDEVPTRAAMASAEATHSHAPLMQFDEEAEEAGRRLRRHVLAFVDEHLDGVGVGPAIDALRQCIGILEMQQRKQGRAA